MRRGAPDHWKMRELANLMKVPARWALPWANGTIERLFHYAAKYHPQGDVGKAPNWAIAEACGFPPASANELVEALVGSRWLDLDKTHRLLVHDWPEHCDDTVKKTLKNRGLAFFFPENSSTVDGKIRPSLSFPQPSLSQPQPTEKSVVVVVDETHLAMRDRFPTVNRKFAMRLAAKVHEVCPDASDCEIAEAVRIAWFKGQASAGLYLGTVPAVVQNIRDRGRDSPQKSIETQEESNARMISIYAGLDAGGRRELEQLRPDLNDLWPKDAPVIAVKSAVNISIIGKHKIG